MICECCNNELTKWGMHTDMLSDVYAFLGLHVESMPGGLPVEQLGNLEDRELVPDMVEAGYLELKDGVYFITEFGKQEMDKFPLDY